MPEPETTEPTRSMVVQKPKSNVYTALLGISALALVIGSVVLFLEVADYATTMSPSGIFEAIRGPGR